MNDFYGIEISESCIDIASKRLAQFVNFKKENLLVSVSEQSLTSHFDLIVAWQMLYYNDTKGLATSIANLHDWLKPGVVLICTLITSNDVKVKHSVLVDENTYVIDGRIPTQDGCKVFSPRNKEEFLGLFSGYDILDVGYYERASYLSENTASEYYLVAKKR